MAQLSLSLRSCRPELLPTQAPQAEPCSHSFVCYTLALARCLWLLALALTLPCLLRAYRQGRPWTQPPSPMAALAPAALELLVSANAFCDPPAPPSLNPANIPPAPDPGARMHALLFVPVLLPAGLTLPQSLQLAAAALPPPGPNAEPGTEARPGPKACKHFSSGVL